MQALFYGLAVLACPVGEVVPGLVEVEVAVPRSAPAVR